MKVEDLSLARQNTAHVEPLCSTPFRKNNRLVDLAGRDQLQLAPLISHLTAHDHDHDAGGTVYTIPP
jgi:hypothetical protein